MSKDHVSPQEYLLSIDPVVAWKLLFFDEEWKENFPLFDIAHSKTKVGDQFSWLTYLVIGLRRHVFEEVAPVLAYRRCRDELINFGNDELIELIESQEFEQLAEKIEHTSITEKEPFRKLGKNISEIKEFNEVVINFLSGIPHQRFQFRTWKGRGLPLDGSDTPKLVLDFFLAIANGELSTHDFSRLFKEVIMVKKDESDILTEEHLNALVGVAKDILLFQETPSDAKKKMLSAAHWLIPYFQDEPIIE